MGKKRNTTSHRNSTKCLKNHRLWRNCSSRSRKTRSCMIARLAQTSLSAQAQHSACQVTGLRITWIRKWCRTNSSQVREVTRHLCPCSTTTSTSNLSRPRSLPSRKSASKEACATPVHKHCYRASRSSSLKGSVRSKRSTKQEPCSIKSRSAMRPAR